MLQCVPFPDHHRHTPADLEQVVNGARLMNAQALVTTEKDGVRLLSHLPLPLPVLALRVEMAVLDRPEEFRARILAAAGQPPRRRLPARARAAKDRA